MDILERIRELEKQRVFIHLTYDHYDQFKEGNGSNCNWSIEFRAIRKQTMWHGDNHEFGDTAECLLTAIEFAEWLLKSGKPEWYFISKYELVDNPEEHKEFWEAADKILTGRDNYIPLDL